MNFAPGSGPVGTIVTLNGSGFTGSTLAWVGAARNAAVTVVSDAQIRVTIPAGATTGAIGIFNSRHAAFTATAFTVTTAAPAYPQPNITSFAPGSGPVGTVVTLSGSGFTGATSARVGAANNAAVTVVNDAQVRVTIPVGATSGAIGIFNPTRSAFTATSFTVTGAATTNPQQSISNFSPSSGGVGTVVTINGSGFTGTTLAWVGAAHNASVSVVSDTQLRVTIPAGATTGAIGIFNPAHAAFTATSFSVQ